MFTHDALRKNFSFHSKENLEVSSNWAISARSGIKLCKYQYYICFSETRIPWELLSSTLMLWCLAPTTWITHIIEFSLAMTHFLSTIPSGKVLTVQNSSWHTALNISPSSGYLRMQLHTLRQIFWLFGMSTWWRNQYYRSGTQEPAHRVRPAKQSTSYKVK